MEEEKHSKEHKYSKEHKQKNMVMTIFTIIIVIILIAVFSGPGKVDVTAELTTCINQKSELYVQEGCGACEQQKAMFGKHYSLLNSIDCKYEPEKCGDIQATPTWIIAGQKQVGVQEINKLKKLTNC